MHRLKKVLFLLAFVTVAAAQTPSPDPPLAESRISVSTLLREDIFSGFLADDMERFARGEKNVDILLSQRPAEKSTLLAWKALTRLYRAIRANDAKQPAEFQRLYKQALDLFDEAAQAGPNNPGLAAIRGGTFVVLADRLPKEYRADAWAKAYESYLALWKFQALAVNQLPVHLSGELLGGLAQSAQRTGRKEEAAEYADKIISVLHDTPYESIAKKWKANPESAATASITCLTCHDAGRLSARLATLNK
ncbi:MAG TPA: hypothetical protein VKM94_19595 [Blastocatellia bacterium]|nr:hypothetical protein [Blastocatellia bacterium]